MVTRDAEQPSRLAIRVENTQTWFLTDRFDVIDVGGVTYQHDSHGNHYRPWLLVEGVRIDIGTPSSHLDHAAQAIEGELLRRATLMQPD